MIKLEEYSEVYLELSWEWLNDKDIKALTNTPQFSKESQNVWFESLKNKTNYKIWGVSYDNIPIGVFGIKNIDTEDKVGEYWGYIGRKEYWGKGLGKQILLNLLNVAKDDLFLENIVLKVLIDNEVAINLYKKVGFNEVSRQDGLINMVKKL